MCNPRLAATVFEWPHVGSFYRLLQKTLVDSDKSQKKLISFEIVGANLTILVHCHSKLKGCRECPYVMTCKNFPYLVTVKSVIMLQRRQG